MAAAPPGLAARAGRATDYQRTLDQLVAATQLRHPVVGGLARRVRYTCFDAPLIAAERAARPGSRCATELDRLADDPDPAERAAQIDAMVAAGEPILGVFGAAAPRRDARGDDPALLPHPHRCDDLRVDRARRPPAAHRELHRTTGGDYVVLATTVHTDGRAGAERPDRRRRATCAG